MATSLQKLTANTVRAHQPVRYAAQCVVIAATGYILLGVYYGFTVWNAHPRDPISALMLYIVAALAVPVIVGYASKRAILNYAKRNIMGYALGLSWSKECGDTWCVLHPGNHDAFLQNIEDVCAVIPLGGWSPLEATLRVRGKSPIQIGWEIHHIVLAGKTVLLTLRNVRENEEHTLPWKQALFTVYRDPEGRMPNTDPLVEQRSIEEPISLNRRTHTNTLGRRPSLRIV